MKYPKIHIFAAILLMFCKPLFAQFEDYNHPELKWEISETEHFNIIYHTGEKRTPSLIAKIAEEIYGPITTAYNFTPDSKIDIVVRDHDDYSNGAAYYYDNKIEIWAPSLDFLLRGANNWLRNVVTHEFVHMIQMQTARKTTRKIPAAYFQYIGYEDERRPDVLYGFPNRIVSYPFAGTVIPGWFAEGVAQFNTMSEGYDSWDSHRDMILRMRATSEGILPLAEMGVFGKSSIGNETVYNQGFAFVTYLANRFGDTVLEKISREMSTIWALNIEGAISRATGQSADILYGSWKSDIELSYLRKTEQIEKNLALGTIIRNTGTGNVYPKWSPDGRRIAFLSNDKSDYLSATGLFVMELSEKGWSEPKLIVNNVVSPPTWSPSGTTIVYSRIKKNDSNSHFNELHLYDFETKKEKQITHNLRARYPSFAPDGNSIFYASGQDGIASLNEINLRTGETRPIKAFTGGKDIFTSSVSPDGNRIVFAVSSNFGRNIAIINRDGSRFRYLIKDESDDRTPEFAPDGRRLYYSSDRTGIFNIYVFDISTGQNMPLTNVPGGAFMPTFDEKNGVVYSLYTSDGYKLAHVESSGYVDEAQLRYESPIQTDRNDVQFNDDDYTELASEPYKIQYRSSSFLPRFMIDYGKPKLGVYVLAGDVLNQYTIFMGAAMNRELDRDLFALFDFKMFRQTLFLELYNITRHVEFFFPPSEVDEVVLGYWEVDAGARQRLSDTQEIQVKTVVSRQSSNIKPIIKGRPFKPLKFDYFKGFNFSIRWRYRDILSRIDSEINPSYGRSITLEYWRNSDEIFEDFVIDAEAGLLQEVYKKYNYHKLTVDWQEYIGLPFILDRSTLTFRLQGGFISENVDDFLYFFAGGLTGIRGYSFYSIEGSRMAIGSLTYRFPLLRSIGFQFGPWYFDKLYGSVGFQAGDAWNNSDFEFDTLKKSVDVGIRLDMFSFYAYPTKIGFNASYGLDRIPLLNGYEGERWKFFLTVLFGYDL